MKRKMSATLLLFTLLLTVAPWASAAGMDLSPAHPLVTDAAAGTVTFLARVNGKYLHQPTRHCVIFEEGKFAGKAVFASLADPLGFHDALQKLGAEAGNNMTPENKETTHVQGDPLDVTVTWKGAAREYDLNEVVKDSNGTPIELRFGGNRGRSEKINTGCLICLDSCPVGIVSNTNYSYGAVEKRGEVGFTGNKDLLPGDGELVTITVKRRK